MESSSEFWETEDIDFGLGLGFKLRCIDESLPLQIRHPIKIILCANLTRVEVGTVYDY